MICECVLAVAESKLAGTGAEASALAIDSCEYKVVERNLLSIDVLSVPGDHTSPQLLRAAQFQDLATAAVEHNGGCKHVLIGS